MNKSGQVMIYGVMLGLVVIILAMALAPSIKQNNDNIRNTTYDSGVSNGLDCSNTAISNFDKATCIAADMNLFIFVGGIILVGIAVITAKIVFS